MTKQFPLSFNLNSFSDVNSYRFDSIKTFQSYTDRLRSFELFDLIYFPSLVFFEIFQYSFSSGEFDVDQKFREISISFFVPKRGLSVMI
jgi:hypothetical protein